MKYYFAPLEGITNYIFRKIHSIYFPGLDKYFAPFISPNQSKKVMTKEMRDLLPENNEGIYLVPQILTASGGDFVATARKLSSLGYEEVNLNLGCPSGTVVAKNKGSGLLAFPEAVERLLDEIFSRLDMKISVKTRLGMTEGDEFYRLLEIYSQYPMEELIIHPRVREDFYKNNPRTEYFEYAVLESKNPLCYNGNLYTKEDIEKLRKRFPDVERLMCGRGLLTDPGFIWQIQNGGSEVQVCQRIMDFHNTLYQAYREYMSGERNVLFKMKEIWFYMISYFPGNEKAMKKIKKAQRLADYEAAVREVFSFK
ncbi:tRNA-dihydrouridine synthase [Catenibacillus scindens]|uniref:tRNA-dihydrouridine synthase n=1 Tax=Catenibacillus scindens TaxID=673271 RepID=A0A7W8HBD6_9FIRM|nr:tRNA-dihydrouridine synthase family protein [Catenibacillus scindens]MBB5265277.1 tRNA-dihydrouridine synthase [Catenibacillus scindens]